MDNHKETYTVDKHGGQQHRFGRTKCTGHSYMSVVDSFVVVALVSPDWKTIHPRHDMTIQSLALMDRGNGSVFESSKFSRHPA